MVLTFNLKKKVYNMILNGEKTTEYRHVCDYWSNRLQRLSKGDMIRFANGYTSETLDAEFIGLDLLTYEELPKYAKSIFYDKKLLWYGIKFKLKQQPKQKNMND